MLVLWSNNESRLSPLFASNRRLKRSVFVQTKHRITFEQFHYLFYAMSDISLSPRRAILWYWGMQGKQALAEHLPFT